MRSPIMKVVDDLYFDYPSPSQRALMEEYAQSMRGRLEVARESLSLEQQAVEALISKLRAQFSQLDDVHPEFWEECAEQLSLTVRAVVQAMLVEDNDYLDDKLLRWLASFLTRQALPQGFVEQAYGGLLESYQSLLPADQFKWVQPYFTRCRDSLKHSVQEQQGRDA